MAIQHSPDRAPDVPARPAERPNHRWFARRSTIELLVGALAIVLGILGVLAHLWILETLGLFAGCVGLGMLLFKWLPAED